jgi:hypothetical protein
MNAPFTNTTLSLVESMKEEIGEKYFGKEI